MHVHGIIIKMHLYKIYWTKKKMVNDSSLGGNAYIVAIIYRSGILIKLNNNYQAQSKF
jgi:hypothetical protein